MAASREQGFASPPAPARCQGELNTTIGYEWHRVKAVSVATANEAEFGELVERHRRELHVHCYRMVGSFDESEDLVQETFLRAWRRRDTFEGRSSLRTWLYRIATNACLDFLDSRRRQPQPYPVPPAVGLDMPSPPAFVPWLQPFPDALLEPAAPRDDEPDAAVVDKETIELAFLVAIQHLPPRQRATLILRDVLGWPAGETANLLDSSVASVNSALQRARATVKEHLPARRLEWPAATDPTEAERELLQRCMATLETADAKAFAAMISEDIRVTMPPNELWFHGRDPYVDALVQMFDPASPKYFGQWRSLPTRANRMPALGQYIKQPGDTTFRAQVLDVLHVEDGKIVEITAFHPSLFPAFGLPMTLR